MFDRVTTRTSVDGSDDGGKRHPNWTVIWERDTHWPGFTGKGTVWLDGNTTAKGHWTAHLSLSIPAERLSLSVEPCSGGSWRFYSLPAHLDLSTFWWASALFLEAMRTHPYWKAD